MKGAHLQHALRSFSQQKEFSLAVIRQFCVTGCISRKQGSGRPTKVTAEIKELVETQMNKDNENTAYQLHKLLTESGYSLSISTVLRCRLELGWTFRGIATYTVIRNR